MKLSIIVPAFNEENYLPRTLAAIDVSRRQLLRESGQASELIVADNASSDATAKYARSVGAKTVFVGERGISQARNAGARAATGDVLVFIDADTIIPAALLSTIAETMAEAGCTGGGVDTLYRPKQKAVSAYLALWRVASRLTGMVQGATQFCRRDDFETLGGYDESLYMGEDVDFIWRLSRHARRRAKRVVVIRNLRVEPSCRRFDNRAFWTIINETNPLTVFVYRKQRDHWTGWYDEAPR